MQFLKSHWWKFFLIAAFFCAVWFPAYSCGSDAGYVQGHSDGMVTGHEYGYAEGHDKGYLVGFNEGLTGAPSAENAAYIGNSSSHVFHSPKCSFLPSKSNSVYFADRQSALDKGYHSCSKCHP